MRIRKNANLSLLLYPQSSRAPESVHVCQLNQSPWDVIHFSHHPSSFNHFQFETEDSFNGNGSLRDSVGGVESVTSMMGSEEKTIMKMEGSMITDNNDDGDEMKISEQFGFKGQCEEGKEWKLKSSDNSSDSGNNIISSLTRKKNNDNNQLLITTGSRRGRGRAAKKGSSSAAASNPYEFYYYSGFGPSWGKRRGGNSDNRGGEISKKKIIIEAKDVENNSSAIITTQQNTSSSTSQIDNNEELDYVDDFDDEDSGRKRTRKPIKARSLKSLM